jgi:FdrA protein
MSMHLRVKKNCYRDSVKLMQISQVVKSLPGVQRASAIMGTENNKATLVRGGFDASSMGGAGPSDILFIVEATADDFALNALDRYLALLDETVASMQEKKTALLTIKDAVASLPGSNVCFISVPGEFAAYEAHKALRAGLHVHIFSDNVPMEDEVKLKRLGHRLGLLVMGPDCGTAIIGGTPIGFANAVSRGPIGLVGASGTGIQQVSVLIDRFGSGISHAIGLGGRDLSDKVGGISALMAIDALERDPTTRVLVFISKPPEPMTAKRILERIGACAKPVVVAVLGGDRALLRDVAHVAEDLEEASRMAVELAENKALRRGSQEPGREELESIVAGKREAGGSSRVFLRGLFTGGSLADEAQLVLGKFLGPLRSNCTNDPGLRISGSGAPDDHAIIDMGDDEFTVGRPHPMIDPSYRAERILEEWRDPRVAVILCDLVLGYGSHPNPATPVAEAVMRARAQYGDCVTVVASVCGTESDSQVSSKQETILREGGILVLPTNASAARIAGRAAQHCAGRSVK